MVESHSVDINQDLNDKDKIIKKFNELFENFSEKKW